MKKTPYTESRWYLEGLEAATLDQMERERLPAVQTANPYGAGSPKAYLWDAGYTDGWVEVPA